MFKTNKSTYFLFIASLIVFVGVAAIYKQKPFSSTSQSKSKKVYWFIPDGFRADRGDFNIFKWAQNGELPHIKTLMDSGCYGYSWPVFPGHTPVNFATLMTGLTPDKHGVSDGAMRLQGYPLNMVATGGFSSFAKSVPAIWSQLESSGYLVSLQSVPGSTPPELFTGNTIKGRWGAWGIEFPAIIFQDRTDPLLAPEIDQNKRVFNLGSELTSFIDAKAARDWQLTETDFNQSDEYEFDLTNWDAPLFAVTYKNSLLFSFDKKTIAAHLQVGDWSNWIPINLKYKLKDDYQKDSPKKTEIEKELSSIEVSTFMKIKLIRMNEKSNVRIRILYDGLNDFSTVPDYLASDIGAKIGPMVDFVDNFPPQLVYFNEDRQTFIQESNMSWDWHKKIVPYLVNNLKSDVVIQSIYSPNQMLTSRWWLPYLDTQSLKYNQVSEHERKLLWSEVKDMYKKADDLIGEIMKNTTDDWYIVLSSDHGAVPLFKEVRLNNLFAQKGWLKFKTNPKTGEVTIDWKNTKVVYLQMYNIYINSENLDGPYKREKTKNYYKLRSEVYDLLKNLKDSESHQLAASHVFTYEEALKIGLPEDRVGDIILSNAPQYGWTEDMTADLKVFVSSLKGGYKQGVWPDSTEAMLTPFIIAGPDVKNNCELPRIINHVDQFATLQKILGFKSPYETSGKIINEIFIREQ